MRILRIGIGINMGALKALFSSTFWNLFGDVWNTISDTWD